MNTTVIKNAHIFDPGCNRDEYGSILIEGNKIIAYDEQKIKEDTLIVDAKGNYVLPGLIDFHTHIAFGMGETGLHCDLMTLPNGITAAVDAGSCGSVTFDGFVKYIVPNNETTVKAFCHVSPLGIATDIHTETTNPAHYDEDRLRALFEKYYPDYFLGLKIRLGKLYTPGQGVEPLIAAKKIARNIGCPMCVHLNNSEVEYGEVLDLLDEGDVLCHCYQGMGKTILGDDGKILDAVWRARERGVLFDAATGRINHNFRLIEKALDQGFLPDIISTDTIFESVYQHQSFCLLYVLSYLYDAGIPLNELIRACTATPAKVMHMEGKIGTLNPGAFADIAIVKLGERPITYRDKFGTELKGNHLFIPLATFKGGRAVYKRIEFEYWDESTCGGI